MADKVRKLKDSASRHLIKGRTEKALADYQEVVRLEPRDLASRQRCGDLLKKLGRTTEAISAYQAVAGAYAADGLLLKAIALGKVILQIDPEHTETQKTLAELYARKRGPAKQTQLSADMSAAMQERTVPVTAQAQTSGDAPHDYGAFAANAIELPDVDADMEFSSASETWHDQSADVMAQIGLGDAASSGSDSDAVIDVDDEIAFVDADEEDVDEIDVVNGVEISLVSLAPDSLPPIPLFSDLPKNAFLQLLDRLSVRQFSPGDAVIVEGSRGDSFFIIVSGEVQVTRAGDASVELELARLGEGAFFGEMALMGDGDRAASVRAVSDIELLEITRDVMNELEKSFPSVVNVMQRFYRHRLLSNLLATSPMFSPLDADTQKSLIEKFKSRELKRGVRVITEGQTGDGLYVVLSGACEVSRQLNGRRVLIAELGTGDLFGEMSLLTRQPVSATVTTKRKSILLRLPARTFTDMAMSHPNILQHVSQLSDVRLQTNSTILGEQNTCSHTLV